jgi:hypothetical protein
MGRYLVARAIKLSPAARVVYVTPANQFPLGMAMSAERRVELLSWAAHAGAWIIEDEYDAEYRYSGKPLASLHSLDRTGSVIYVGTFTKMLFNALRIGFIVVPERVSEAFRIARTFFDRHAPTLDQAVLTEFINEGHFGHHVRKMRQVYSDRSQLLAEEAKRRLSGLLDVEHALCGRDALHYIAHGCPFPFSVPSFHRLFTPAPTCTNLILQAKGDRLPTQQQWIIDLVSVFVRGSLPSRQVSDRSRGNRGPGDPWLWFLADFESSC